MDFDMFDLGYSSNMDLETMIITEMESFQHELSTFQPTATDSLITSNSTPLPSPNSPPPPPPHKHSAQYPNTSSIQQQHIPDPTLHPNFTPIDLFPIGGDDSGSINNNGYSSFPHCGASGPAAAMREVLLHLQTALRPVYIGPEELKPPPKRRNVRISKEPQSVAARHRRERISERIRILQRMVPGGTKMDTASMLDEAVHYVKYLKTHVEALQTAVLGGGRVVGAAGQPPPLPPYYNHSLPSYGGGGAYQYHHGDVLQAQYVNSAQMLG